MESLVDGSAGESGLRRVLEHVRREQRRIDVEELPKFHGFVRKHGGELTSTEVAIAMADGHFGVSDERGRLLYTLTRAMRPGTVVEFGTAHGFSALHIAAALRDNGHGVLVGTEIDSRKVRSAEWNVAAAGLSDFVEIRLGEASDTLAGLGREVDFVHLDGWVAAFVPVLEVVRPFLRPGALVLADHVSPCPELSAAYRAHVDDPQRGFSSTTWRDVDGMVLSTYLG